MILEVLKEKKKVCEDKTLYTVKMAFKNEDEMVTFSGKWQLRVSITHRPALQEMFKAILHAEEKLCHMKMMHNK